MSEHAMDKPERSTKRLPKGNYALVSVDVDTTGRRLIDEIVQLSAYTPNDQFGQYIMPIMNLNPAARQRHQIRVITVGFFRMLKSMQTYKVVKTKSEIGTLKDFLSWLEKINAETKDSRGVIMIYHEQRKFIPYMILEAMGKYGLLPRFFSTVKSFADSFALAESTLGNTIKYFTLKQLAKVILQEEEVTEKDRYDFEGNASVRVRLAYQIIEKLALKEAPESASATDAEATEGGEAGAGAAAVKSEDTTDMTPEEKMLKLVCEHATPMNDHVAALNDQNKCLERQNSLRPIFVNYFKVTLYHRVKGVTFRRVLADHGYDLEMLQEIWEAKKADGLHESIASMEELKPDEKNELVELLDCHFDPEKQDVLPLVKKHKTKRGGTKENVKPNNSGPTSPDSMSKTPQKRSRRRRPSFNVKQAQAAHANAANANNGSANAHNANGERQQANSAATTATAPASDAKRNSLMGNKVEALAHAIRET